MSDSLLQFRRWLGMRIAYLARWVYPDATVYDICAATSPENERCILPLGHVGSHFPASGRGWAWG